MHVLYLDVSEVFLPLCKRFMDPSEELYAGLLRDVGRLALQQHHAVTCYPPLGDDFFGWWLQGVIERWCLFTQPEHEAVRLLVVGITQAFRPHVVRYPPTTLFTLTNVVTQHPHYRLDIGFL